MDLDNLELVRFAVIAAVLLFVLFNPLFLLKVGLRLLVLGALVVLFLQNLPMLQRSLPIFDRPAREIGALLDDANRDPTWRFLRNDARR